MGNDNAKPESRYNFELTEENEIGKGQFGKVYLVSTVDKQTLCAAKFFNLAYKYMTE
jgi:predicted Ser/Thr protein kinase